MGAEPDETYHGAASVVQNDLALLYRSMGRGDEAERYHERAAAIPDTRR